MSYEIDCISDKTKWKSVKAIGRIDVILDEGHSRSRVGNSIDNLLLIRKIVFNLTKLDNSMGTNLTLKKKMTRYTSDFKNIENIIFQVIPSLN